MGIEEIYARYKESFKVVKDTRENVRDCMYFSLKGESFNGNKYAKEALDNGARYAVIDEKKYLVDDRMILVDDVLQKYLEFKVDLAKKQVGADDSELAKYQLYEKRALTICTKLKTVGFHDKVIRMCKLNMNDSKFIKKMDENV